MKNIEKSIDKRLFLIYNALRVKARFFDFFVKSDFAIIINFGGTPEMNYVAPEFELVLIETNDIIADSDPSLAVKPGDNSTEVSDSWWD